MQGNGAATAGWAAVSISFIHAHKMVQLPLAQSQNFTRRLWVFCTWIIRIYCIWIWWTSRWCIKFIPPCRPALTAGVNSWSPQVEHLSYQWDHFGKWKYKANEKRPEIRIAVCLSDGGSTSITHLDQNHTWYGSCPLAMQMKWWVKRRRSPLTRSWLRCRRNQWAGQLKQKIQPYPWDIHFNVLAKMKFGLCDNNTSYDKLVAVIDKLYRILYQLEHD